MGINGNELRKDIANIFQDKGESFKKKYNEGFYQVILDNILYDLISAPIEKREEVGKKANSKISLLCAAFV